MVPATGKSGLGVVRALQRVHPGADGQPDEEGSSMNLGERCDEIVRLIDETLAGLVIDADADARNTPPDHGGRVATVTPLAAPRGREGSVRRGAPETPARPGRAAAGF